MDILMALIFIYFGQGYISVFFFTALAITIPVDLVLFKVLPQLDTPFYDWSDNIDELLAPPPPEDPLAF